MNFASLASATGAMLANLSLAITQKLDPGAIYQQVQRLIHPAIEDLDIQGSLSPAQRAEIRHRPVEARHF
jgi:regulator of sirC expression with transglutaminase-like and TPR domain